MVMVKTRSCKQGLWKLWIKFLKVCDLKLKGWWNGGEHEAVCGVVVTGGAAGALWGCVITLLFHSAPWTLVAWAGTEAGPGLRLRTCQWVSASLTNLSSGSWCGSESRLRNNCWVWGGGGVPPCRRVRATSVWDWPLNLMFNWMIHLMARGQLNGLFNG